MAQITDEMKQWLADNRDTYAFYLLHAMMHDPLMRAAMLSVPVTDDDFEREEHSLIVAALTSAVKIMHVIGHQVPCPPTYEFLRTYLEVAAKTESSDDEIVAIAVKLIKELQDPSFCEQHYCIRPYFEAWYGSIRAKKAALVLRRDVIPDVPGQIVEMQRSLSAAAQAVAEGAEDPMQAFAGSQILERTLRRPTGITGLDECLNGGWGPNECYLLFGGTGGGKCYSKGTRILMYDGITKAVEDVVVGDLLMGPDSTPRKVTELVRGREEMFRITPLRSAEPVVVNRSHTLTLAVTNIGKRTVRSSRGVAARSGTLIDVPLDDYLASSKKFRHVTKWVQAGIVVFPQQASPLEIPPYLLGFWLGDGCKWHPEISKPGCERMLREIVESAGWTCVRRPDDPDRCEKISITGGFKAALRKLGLIRNKHVPAHFLVASIDERAALLAGLLDSDGCVAKSGWEFSNTQEDLVNAVAFLGRSLGYSVTVSSPRVTRGFDVDCTSWRALIQPYGDVVLPVKRVTPPTRRQIKNPLTNGFSVESLGEGDYYGFSVEGPDRRYLLGDFSITHNSIAAGQCAWWEASHNHGWPLIVTTELHPREYAVRTVSNAAGIPINVVQDCENVAQIRQAVMSNPASMYRIKKVDEVLAKFLERTRIHKVSPDDGMNLQMLLERECMIYKSKMGHDPTWVCLDWLGSVADAAPGGKHGGTSERAMLWEQSANSGVEFADRSGIPTLLLAQAVNDAQLKRILTINDIGISKGLGKNMVAVIGVTNTIDKAGIVAAERGKADMPRSMFLDDQLFCLCKARKGEGNNIQVRREFRFQRFTAKTA